MTAISDLIRAKAFASGEKAAAFGKPITSCRWQRGTIYYDDWHDGYQAVAPAESLPA